MQESVKLGIYRHYKGNEYHVYGVATHSETQEPLVVYRCLYDDFGLWVRPKKMFEEFVDVNGAEVRRFEWIREADDGSALV